jgi:2,5-diketo-D-gluconate reductase A
VTSPNRLITLNNGVQMPILGFGVFQVPGEQTEQVVTDALAAGYRSIDTAASYGNARFTPPLRWPRHRRSSTSNR